MHRIHGLGDYSTMALNCTASCLTSTSKGHQCWDQKTETFRIHQLSLQYAAEGWPKVWGCSDWKSNQPGTAACACVLKESLATEARNLCTAIIFSHSQDQRGHPKQLQFTFEFKKKLTVCFPGEMCASTWKHMKSHDCFFIHVSIFCNIWNWWHCWQRTYAIGQP